MSQRAITAARLFLAAAGLTLALACTAQTPATASGNAPVVSTPASDAAAAPAQVAAPSTLDDQARFLAGLPVSAGSVLAPLQALPDYKDHVAALAKDWPKLVERLDKMTAWESAELGPRIQRDRKVIYLFGGPDAIHVMRLFPDAPAYLLAGLEPVGSVEAPEKLKFQDVHTAIDSLSYAIRTTIPKSFFRTTEMGRDLQGRGIRGVLPVLYLFLSRSGAVILETTNFEIDGAGLAKDKAASEKWGAGVPGVRVKYQLPGKPVQEMTYVRVNLIDEELAKNPGFLTWARSFGPANGFLKAASFILHDKAFSMPRAFLLENCTTIVEDDSGIPYRAFQKGQWSFTCFGHYMRPRDPFESHMQNDLDKVCKEQVPFRPLPFIAGYRRSNDTFLLLAQRAPVASQGPASAPAEASQAAGTTPPVVQPAPPAVAR